MFARMGLVAEALGLADGLPDCGPAAGLDGQGNVWLDQDVVERVRHAFIRRRGPAYVEEVEQTRDGRCAALVSATKAAGEAAASPDLDPGTARATLGEIEGRMSELLPYAILTKFVPELLLQALQDAGDHGPLPIPSPSPGAKLSGDLLDLHLHCLARGYPAERLETEWPEIDSDVAARVRSFCKDHTGFGPVTWEAPGMETPLFVIGSMRTAFAGTHAQSLLDRLPPEGGEQADAPLDPWTGQLRTAIRAWLEYMDLEIWYLRAAFYLGVLPLLRRYVLGGRGAGDVAPSDLLFAEIGPLLEGRLDARTLHARRVRYWADTEYVSRNSVLPDRLTELMEGS